MKKWNSSPGLGSGGRRAAVLAGVAAGVLIGTTYIPFPPWAILFCYVPLFVFWSRTRSLTHAFLAGWIAQFILSVIGFHWIAHLAVEFGHLPEIVGWLVMIGFASFIHLHIPFAGLLFTYSHKKLTSDRNDAGQPRPAILFWLLPLTIFTVETCYPMLFPWNLGYTLLWAKIPLYHFADVIGFVGLSGFVFFANAILAWLWIHRAEQDPLVRRKWKNIAFSFVVGLPFLVFMGQAYGERQRTIYEPEGSPSFKALLVQANIGNFEKFWAEKRADFRTPIIDRYTTLTEDAITDLAHPGIDLVVWPETAFPDALDEYLLSAPNQQRFVQLVRKVQAQFIVGGYSEDPRHLHTFNSIFQFDREGRAVAKYHKRRLLAFGEYFPGSDVFPFLKTWFPEIPDFERGKISSPMVLTLHDQPVPAALQICYEGLFPSLTQDFFVGHSSDIIVNVTNDSWYDAYFEPRQHMTMTLARGIEFRRPLLRVTNTGISTVILASGEMLLQSPMSVEWSHIYDIPYRPQAPVTIYAQICSFMPWLLWLGLLLTWGAFYARTRKRNGQDASPAP